MYLLAYYSKDINAVTFTRSTSATEPLQLQSFGQVDRRLLDCSFDCLLTFPFITVDLGGQYATLLSKSLQKRPIKIHCLQEISWRHPKLKHDII